MKKEIVKVQISLFSSDGITSVMVYNKDKTCMSQFPIDEDGVKKLGMEDEPKKFFYANIPTKPGYIKLLEEAPWQDW